MAINNPANPYSGKVTREKKNNPARTMITHTAKMPPIL